MGMYILGNLGDQIKSSSGIVWVYLNLSKPIKSPCFRLCQLKVKRFCALSTAALSNLLASAKISSLRHALLLKLSDLCVFGKLGVGICVN